MAGRLSPYLEENYYEHYLKLRLVDSEPSNSLLQNVQDKDKQFSGTSVSHDTMSKLSGYKKHLCGCCGEALSHLEAPIRCTNCPRSLRQECIIVCDGCEKIHCSACNYEADFRNVLVMGKAPRNQREWMFCAECFEKFRSLS